MSVIKADANKYRIFVSDGFNLNGSRRRFSKTIETDLKGRNLEKFLTLAEFEFEDEVKKKDPRFKQLASGSFEAYANWWLEYKQDNIAPKTHAEYSKLLKTRINPYIGNKILDQLKTPDMLELFRIIKNSTIIPKKKKIPEPKTENKKISINTVKHYHSVLTNMFNDAVELKILNENPMHNVKVAYPKPKLKNNFLNIDGLNKVLSLLPNEPVKYQLITLIAVTTSARLGEITGLEWSHVNLEKLEIKIEQANSYTKAKGSFIKSTKNTHSERTTAFPAFLVPLFEKHKENEDAKKEYLTHKNNFIFTQANGKIIFVDTPSKWWNKFVKRNNLKPVTFHGLRHTNATILISRNIDIASISKLLGHAKISTTTDNYVYPLKSVERKIADTFEDILQSGSQSGSQTPNLRVIK